MDSKVVDQSAYHIEDCNKFDVKVADGRILTCDSECSKIKLIIQGQELLVDFFLLPLEDFEVVLGIEWLSILSDVFWNFSKLIMKFFINRKRVILKGRRSDKVTAVTSHRMERVLQKTEMTTTPEGWPKTYTITKWRPYLINGL
ncbi:hypothetical protein MUK42_34117 [Musa troglodytarum]|uniref:RVP_2 domain-containing protein n=1 Tax=Musa troglodytarum TaxID=320322 RepID=A0A9E7HIM9_9LILI|nr:hypothetical protein MUK42_34117 [Musa troglodytarum]URE31798.1 hypothetical protein MUK42_34117 [Musa troglodytarum]